ncbi:hypothetical protein V2O64_02405 [Verrucomicrobiaceae bacterium 227]
MSQGLPPEIESGLVSLRRRIRKVQLVRGLFRTATVLLGGVLLIVALDYFFAPLASMVRGALFFLWLAAILVAVVVFVVIPMSARLSLIRLARWLENQHPEVQERISTALEIAERPEGISPELLSELSREAALDVSALDPEHEVQTKRIRRSIWPAVGIVASLLILLAVWPREMGRLLTRAISPFSELGNAGAFRFELKPGDVEVLEGDEIVLDLTYSGNLDQPLELLIDRDGKIVSEALSPSSSDGETHTYRYQVASAAEGFRYSARVGSSESDRFQVKVYPLPRLLEPVVSFQYPPYTEWPDRKASLGSGVQAIAGTRITVSGRFDTPLESGQLLLDGEKLGEVTLDGSAAGTKASWSQTLKPGQAGLASMMVQHRLGRELEGARFAIESSEDPAPEVTILTPVQREFRVKPGDQIIMTYEVIEAIGLSRAAIELEVNGQTVEPLLELLPDRVPTVKGDLWEGEAMVYLGSLISQHKNARKIRMRLALSDNRPAELEGPGVGYSEWLEITLDQNAESLVRQELRKQDRDFHKTVDQAVSEIHKARSKIHEARNDLNKEEVSERAEQKLAEARDRLQEAKEALSELTERMEQSIQAHRIDEVEEAIAGLEDAQTSVEHTPLQDTPEGRQAEVENALRESGEAIDKLQKLKQEVYQDQPKMDDLARLQELAQKQEQLAREAAENEGEAPDQEWQNEQRQMQNQLREEVRQTPEAKAASLAELSEKTKALAEEAGALKESQESLSELNQGKPAPDEAKALAEALTREQEAIVAETKDEISAAMESQESRAEDLPKALEDAQAALESAQNSKPKEAAESAHQAAEEMAKGAEESPSQKALQDKQEQVAEAFEALAEGDAAKARETLAELQNERAVEAISKALAKEQEAIVEGTQEELSEARGQQEARANDLPEALAQAEAALEGAEQGNPGMAAEAAQSAAEELRKGAEAAPSQQALAEKQEQLAEAFEALAEGDIQKALSSLEQMQSERAAELARDIQDVPQVEGDQLGQARSESRQGAQKAAQAAKAQGEGKSQMADQQHQQSAKDFGQARAALEQAAQNLAKQAMAAAEQPSNDRKAPAPGEQLAEAFQQSAEAASAGDSQQAAQSSQAAAEALRQAANQAQSSMKQGGKPGQPMAQAPPGQKGQPQQPGGEPGDEPDNKMRQAQGDQGVPPELAKLGISAGDWEKIQATLKSEISGSAGSVVPDDYRGLVKQYFEQVSKER